MNIKRAFLAAVAVLMLPGAALAQSTVTFDVGANFFGADEMVTANLTCNSGIPLEQSFDVGGPDRVNFAVTEFTPGSCEVTFGAAPEGFSQTGVDINQMWMPGVMSCVFDDGTNGEVIAATNMCTARYAAAPVDFEVTVEWTFTDDADVSLAEGSTVMVMCGGTSTTWDAGPSQTWPQVLMVTPEDTCSATLYANSSAIVSDSSDCQDVDIEYAAGSTACTITAGVFFEGIPTLSQYGMAIMALLMLAVGFVGFRRFV